MTKPEPNTGTLASTGVHVNVGRPAKDHRSFVQDGRIWTIALILWENGVEAIGVFTLCDCLYPMHGRVSVLTSGHRVSCSYCKPEKSLPIPAKIAANALNRQEAIDDAAWSERASTPLGPRAKIPI